MGQSALHLRKGIQRENKKSPVHCMVFAQQSDAGGEEYPYGSKEILQYSQVHLAITRERAMADWIIPGKVDALGNPRFFHKAGNWHAKTTLKIAKGNDNGPGAVKVIFENGLGRIYNADKQGNPVI